MDAHDGGEFVGVGGEIGEVLLNLNTAGVSGRLAGGGRIAVPLLSRPKYDANDQQNRCECRAQAYNLSAGGTLLSGFQLVGGDEVIVDLPES